MSHHLTHPHEWEFVPEVPGTPGPRCETWKYRGPGATCVLCGGEKGPINDPDGCGVINRVTGQVSPVHHSCMLSVVGAFKYTAAASNDSDVDKMIADQASQFDEVAE